MKINKVLFLIIIGSFLLQGCENGGTQSKSSEFFAMDTVMKITIYGEKAEEGLLAAKNLINRYDSLFSTNLKDSDVSKINQSAGSYVTVSDETYELIEKSIELSELTQGIFDISIYPVVTLWGFTTGQYKVPAKEERERALAKVNYKNIHLGENNQVMIEKGMSIDLGGIAKGYTSQKVREELISLGVVSAMISLGGNVQTVGGKEDGDFVVGITDPADTSNLIGTVSVNDEVVISSGDYERFFEKDGKRYHHIMDKRTGAPADSDLQSVTVVGKDGTTADGLSTALFVMGSEKAMEFQKKHSEIGIILVLKDGVTKTSDNFIKKFKRND